MAYTTTPSAAAAPPLLPSPRRTFCRPFISCGPRSNRGPLLRGRILSTEAILAIQTLKRAYHRDPSTLPAALSVTLSRLLKPDLLAALRELLRQDRTDLALHVFAAARQELWYRTDYGLCADVVLALAREGMGAEVDGMVGEVVEEGLLGGDERGLGRLVRAVIAAERAEAVVGLWGMMKKGNWACEERLARAMSRGLRQMGEVAVAEEVERYCQLFE